MKGSSLSVSLPKASSLSSDNLSKKKSSSSELEQESDDISAVERRILGFLFCFSSASLTTRFL